MQRFPASRRRARLARRHGLVDRHDDALAATEAMVVLHATDPATVFLSALARMKTPDLEAVSRVLYDDRSLVRMLAMRRTLFIVPRVLLEVVERSSTDGVALTERKRLEQFLAESGISDPASWLSAAAAEVVEALDGASHAGVMDGLTARQLTADVPRLATKITMAAGTRNSVQTGATSRVLGVLANEGVLIRGRPTGAWTNRTYRWHRREGWLKSGSTGMGAGARTGSVGTMDGAGAYPAANPTVDPLVSASAQLMDRWLRTFGPAPISDIKWWTGWTMRQVKATLSTLSLVEVDLGGQTGVILADDLRSDSDDGHHIDLQPWVSLLPALDPTPMGWKSRSWYLGAHQAPLFDRNGNVGPTVWVDGRIVGGWSQISDGTVVTRLLEDVGADHRAMIEAEAERLTAAIAPTVVKPSFPTPLQKELSAG